MSDHNDDVGDVVDKYAESIGVQNDQNARFNNNEGKYGDDLVQVIPPRVDQPIEVFNNNILNQHTLNMNNNNVKVNEAVGVDATPNGNTIVADATNNQDNDGPTPRTIRSGRMIRPPQRNQYDGYQFSTIDAYGTPPEHKSINEFRCPQTSYVN